MSRYRPGDRVQRIGTPLDYPGIVTCTGPDFVEVLWTNGLPFRTPLSPMLFKYEGQEIPECLEPLTPNGLEIMLEYVDP